MIFCVFKYTASHCLCIFAYLSVCLSVCIYVCLNERLTWRGQDNPKEGFYFPSFRFTASHVIRMD
jgi:hypothetical protein